jgi:hypothetical protein
MFDVSVHLDELRSWPTERLVAHHECLVAEQRRMHLEDLDVLLVLDERGRIDASVGSDGESARTTRENLETARALESLPKIAAAAHDGRLSDDQLRAVAKLADEESDAEWARRAPNVEPGELGRLARQVAKPSTDDSQARYEARSLRMWWTPDKARLHVRGELPDVMGAEFEATITALTERMKPGKGQAWDSFEHRAADALVALCHVNEGNDATLSPLAVMQVLVPMDGPAEIAGVPIADSMLEQLRANASIEPVLVDDAGTPVAVATRVPALSPKVRRAVLLRDGKCRVPGCDRRHGLEAHHLRPRTWGGADELANLAAVCPTHHRQLVPHGRRALAGNPNLPDGLELVDAADLPPP